jgi:hypothetical protein
VRARWTAPSCSTRCAARRVAGAARGAAVVDRREPVVAFEPRVEVDGEVLGAAAVGAAVSVDPLALFAELLPPVAVPSGRLCPS